MIAWQIAHRIEGAPGGTCNCVRQLEQVMSGNIVAGIGKTDGRLNGDIEAKGGILVRI